MAELSCICGCPAGAHWHLRAGTDCSRCSCPGFKPKRWWRRWESWPPTNLRELGETIARTEDFG